MKVSECWCAQILNAVSMYHKCIGLSVFATLTPCFKPLFCSVLRCVPGPLKIIWRQLKSKLYFPLPHYLLYSERGRLLKKQKINRKRHTPGKRKGHSMVPLKRPRPRFGCILEFDVISISCEFHEEILPLHVWNYRL